MFSVASGVIKFLHYARQNVISIDRKCDTIHKITKSSCGLPLKKYILQDQLSSIHDQIALNLRVAFSHSFQPFPILPSEMRGPLCLTDISSKSLNPSGLCVSLSSKPIKAYGKSMSKRFCNVQTKLRRHVANIIN